MWFVCCYGHPFRYGGDQRKAYIINASVEILFVAFVLFVWVETRGLTLEEVDKVFDGVKHSDVPDLETIEIGKGGRIEIAESARQHTVM
jgi:hypothetical protein